MANGNELTREEQAWLVEYQVLQQDASSSNNSFWIMTSIFIGFTSALLGGLVLGILSNEKVTEAILNGSRGSAAFLLVGIIVWLIATSVLVILYLLKSWYRRDRFLWQLNYRRMRQIELGLGMRYNLLLFGLEEWERLKAEIADRVKPEKQESLKNELKEEVKKLCKEIREGKPSEYEPKPGRWHITWVFRTLIALWSLVLLGSLVSLYFYQCIVGLVVLLVTAVLWFAIMAWAHRMPHRSNL